MVDYCLREDIPAVSCEPDGKTKVFKLPAGSVVTVESFTEAPGLIDVLWKGNTVSVFCQDLKSHSAMVRTGAA